jgi:predicted nucleic acid-binding protein
LPAMAKRIVVNTGPLIALMRMEALDIPAKLDLVFLAPMEVRQELEEGALAGHPPVRPDWVTYQPLRSPLSPLVTSVLDVGEAAVIQLALDEGIRQVCIDEWKGRRMALAVGLKVTGAMGLLGKAKRDGIIPEVKPYLNRALQTGIRYHPDLVQRFLEALGE